MRSFRFRASLAFLSFSLSVGLVGCSEKEVVKDEPVIRPVRVVKIAAPGSLRQQTLAGVARASQEMGLSFRVAGTVTDVPVQRGDKVKKGDLIATLDTEDINLEIEQAKASVAMARAEHRSAQADYKRLRSLYADGSASQAELDAGRALEESKRAMLSAEKKGLELSVSKLKDHQLRAPLNGDIADVPVEVNENVQAGSPIAYLNAGEKPEVEVAVPERVIELFKRGNPATVVFDSIPDRSYNGVVSEVGVAASTTSTAFPIRVKLNEADNRVRSGMSALVKIDLAQQKEHARVHVPPGAVREESTSESNYVMIAEPADEGFATVKKQSIELGEPTSFGISIENGLKGGEMVVVAGLSSITDGMKVRLLPRDQPNYSKDRVDDLLGQEDTGVGEKPEAKMEEAPAKEESNDAEKEEGSK